MPTAPNASTDLSGGTGITKTNMIQKVLRRLDDSPYVDTSGGALAAGTTTTFVVASTTPFAAGGVIDWVKDGTFDSAKIKSITNATTMELDRSWMGSTGAVHAANAEFRYQALYLPHTLSELIDEHLLFLWPDLYDVREVNWTITPGVTPERWYGAPADMEKVLSVYQRNASTPSDFSMVASTSDVQFMDSNFIGATKKGISVQGISQSSSNGLLHATYLARLGLTNLTDAQVSILTYLVGAAALETRMAGESRPDRRVSARSAPDPADAWRVWRQRADILIEREETRLRGYLPRTLSKKFQMIHYISDNPSVGPYHPVRP